jgi:cell division protein FtsI (penicillin-binding protein 3)
MLGIINNKNRKISNTLKSSKDFDLYVRKLEDNLQSGVMPDLSGMSLEDVLFFLERYGIEVQFSGFGGVVKQSILSGEKFKKGNIIKLELS